VKENPNEIDARDLAPATKVNTRPEFVTIAASNLSLTIYELQQELQDYTIVHFQRKQ
jgi:hypothetical protein